MEMIQYNEDYVFLLKYECFVKGKIEKIKINNIENFLFWDNKNVKYKDVSEFINKNYDIEKINFDNIFTNRCGICLTDLCQLRCNYCAFSSCDSGDTIDINNIRSYVLYFFKKIKIFNMVNKTNKGVQFYFAGGGEPTYKWDIFQQTICFIRNCEKKYKIKATIGLTTNGILNESQRKFIIDSVDYVLISFDGTNFFQNKNRKTFMGKGSFDIVDKTLCFFDKYNFNYEIRSTIWLDDFVNIKDMYLFINERYKNYISWSFGCVMPRGRATKSHLVNKNIDISKIYLDLQEYVMKNNLKTNFSFMKFKSYKVDYICGTSYGLHPWLLPSGKIITCLDGGDKSPVIGKVSNGRIDFVEYNDYIANVYLKKRRDCIKCFAFSHCGSGCPLNNLDDESIKNEKYECEMIKKYWRMVYDKLLENHSFINFELERKEIEETELLFVKERK
ncbi:MAG: radical SAM protein [Erysipelotrichaceae bacterium]|nr:radical SAM protein [Erysipelotrichaceae bacterium]